MGRALMHRRMRLFLGMTVVMVITLMAPRVPEVLAQVEWFRVTGVTVDGTVHLTSDDVVEVARVASDHNLWDDVAPVKSRIEGHPLVKSVRIKRRLPGTLMVELEERAPVALIAAPVLTPVDSEGRLLPIDPAHHRLDLPLISARKYVERGAGGASIASPGMSLTPTEIRVLALELERLGELDPDLLASVSDVAMDAHGEVALRFGQPRMSLRYRPPLTPRRLQQGLAVLNDALDRDSEMYPETLDLRFVDQVVVKFSESR